MLNYQKIKRNTNDFSFIGTVASLANNREYKSGYLDLLEGKTNDKTYFWTALSAVGEEIGSVIYENVLNYVNNVANINTCRLRALTSIAKVLGVTEFAVLNQLDTIPEDVLKMMDVFSINRSYLLNINTFDTEFVRDVLTSTLDEETFFAAESTLSAMASDSGQTTDLSGLSSAFSLFAGVSDEKYKSYIEEVFFNLLSKKLFQTYGNVSSDFVYANLSSEGLLSGTNDLFYSRASDLNTNFVNNRYWTRNLEESEFRNDYPQLVYRYKKGLNVSPSFDQSKIVDDIEAGLDFLDRYQGGELSVLQLEINERAKEKFSKSTGYASDRLDTRYSYYNEQEVRHYVKFVDDMYVLKQTDAVTATTIDEIRSSLLNWTPYYLKNGVSAYFLDENFSNVSISSNAELPGNINHQWEICKNTPSLSDSFPTLSSFIYDYYGNVFSEEVQEDENLSVLSEANIVRIVARILRDVCLAIVDIREKLKTQSQRNYMTGTKMLVEYILNEYLINTLINTYDTDREKTRSQSVYNGISRQEVGAQIIEFIDTTEYFNIGLLSDEIGYAKPGVNVPFFSELSDSGYSGTTTGKGLSPVDVRNFYLQSLNISSNIISDDATYYDFMSAVYEVGLTKTFVGDAGALYFDKAFLDDGLSITLDVAKISAVRSFTEEDLRFLENNWFNETPEGYRSINYGILSDYYNIVSNDLSVISGEFEKYNDALSTRIAQQTELALKYHGMDIAYYPWYNYKNQDFPTFQSHPYLYNFVEHENDKYAIENAFYGNANEDLVYELQSEAISVYLAEVGNLVRLWRNSPYDYTGYKSRYENSLHNYGSSNSNGLYSVTHYDGLFYPPAIDLYKRYAGIAGQPLVDSVVDENDQKTELSGFDLLSAHMTLFVDEGKYKEETQLDIPEISSMWHYYSHLNLTKNERQTIVDQLLNLSADILEVADANFRERDINQTGKRNLAKPYDIYKYGLDYNNNSVLLLKRYSEGDRILTNADVSQTKKKNTPGALWIKFNSHPIAFPAFLKGGLSSYSNVTLDDNTDDVDWNYTVKEGIKLARTSEFGSGSVVYNVYDFDLASSGKYLVYAIENPSDSIANKTYNNSVTIASRILQRKLTNYLEPEQEERHYMLLKAGPTFLYPNNQGQGDFNSFDLSSLVATDYEFDGYFQNGSSLYAGYFKREIADGLLSKIKFNAIAYPGNEEQSTNPNSKLFTFRNDFSINALSTDFATTKPDAKIKLGYFSKDQIFTIAVANEISPDKNLGIQNFIGFNNESVSSNANLSVGFGCTDYTAATSGDSSVDSFDRLDHLISIYDVDESSIRKNDSAPQPAIYALNSDASYIPLYYGVDGQNLHYMLKDRATGEAISYNGWWHSSDDNVSSDYVPRNSIELLGYSFDNIDDLIKAKENTIYEDQTTEKQTSLDSENLLNSSIRVYEDFLSDDFVYESFNEGFRWECVSGDVQTIKLKVDLSSINQETSSFYNILLLNGRNGQDKNPIIASKFSYSEISDSVYYDSEPTGDEKFFVEHGYSKENSTHIVGTPNPFSVNDTTFGLDYTNHIYNISNVSCNLEWNEDEERFYLNVTLTRDRYVEFAIQSEQLMLFVYRTQLDQFDKYHYMEPFGNFPFNAAMSCWNLPWKDKSHAWIYTNELDDLSAIWAKEGFNDYLDKRLANPRNVAEDSYKPELSSEGVFFNALVHNLPISAYDSETGELSIDLNDSRLTMLSLMENIVLSSLTSFNDSYYLSTGQITWKISEEDAFNQMKLTYPPMLIDTLLYDKFYGCNKTHVSYNVFDLSNTFIFQLEDPLSIANKIGKIAIPVGTAGDEFELVYEDYLSDQYNVDIGGLNFIKYEETLYVPPNDKASVIMDIPDNLDELIGDDVSAINGDLSTIQDVDKAWSVMSSHDYFPECSEQNASIGTVDYFMLSADPKEIADHLKVYVNWRRYKKPGHEEEIELFFNYPNLFTSPYSYRDNDGRFSVEYKPSTYLRLKSGQDGYLYIIFQFKYYDSNGLLCGVRDLPVLTYHIYNVSDDKPKFVITKTYEIDNHDGKYTYPGDDDQNVVYVVVEKQTYKHDDVVDSLVGKISVDEAINYDYKLNTDLWLNTKLNVLSPLPLKYVNIELAYERGKMEGNDDSPEFSFEPDFSSPGEYVEYAGNISAHLNESSLESNLAFTLFAGSKINEESNSRSFPIEILNAEAEDCNGNKPKFVFFNGGIDIDDNTSTTDVATGAYLARELNDSIYSLSNLNLSVEALRDSELSVYVWPKLSSIVERLSGISENGYNAGWIYEEANNALIKIYSLGTAGMKSLLAEGLPPPDSTPVLKTSGTRESRLDRYNDLVILAED